MALDRWFIERNRASTGRVRDLVARLSDEELQHPVGEHWTVAIALAHVAFWDRRMLYLLDQTERAGRLVIPQLDTYVNDIALPFWAAILPHEAARIAVETAEAVDRRLETFPPPLLEEIQASSDRWLLRAWHRNRHLDEVEAALRREF